jgi:quercetin dioxygenase-like cupin family protein
LRDESHVGGDGPLRRFVELVPAGDAEGGAGYLLESGPMHDRPFIPGRRRVSYTVIDVKDFEGRRTPVAQALETHAIRANQFDSAPGHQGYEHDELKSGQEELFVPLAGAGSILIDGETIDLEPGRYVLVQPSARRRVDAGPEGLSYLVIGARVEGEAG